jgi:REP element-mobilizing transposase RayT
LRIENDRERRRRLEAYLDLGFGECWLRQPAIAKLTEDALRCFDGQRYRLAAWAIMPNHIHVLVDIWETPLWQLIKSWKVFVARRANPLLGRHGEFWQREYLETVIEDEDHLRKARRYIENNPAKARLVLDPKAWPWSSARFRDEYGVLSYAHRSADFQSALDSPSTSPSVSHPTTMHPGEAQSRSETGAPHAP